MYGQEDDLSVGWDALVVGHVRRPPVRGPLGPGGLAWLGPGVASLGAGGRGVEMYGHLDSWDVLGEWGMATHEMENHFDVPIKKK